MRADPAPHTGHLLDGGCTRTTEGGGCCHPGGEGVVLWVHHVVPHHPPGGPSPHLLCSRPRTWSALVCAVGVAEGLGPAVSHLYTVGFLRTPLRRGSVRARGGAAFVGNIATQNLCSRSGAVQFLWVFFPHLNFKTLKSSQQESRVGLTLQPYCPTFQRFGKRAWVSAGW